MNSKQKTVIAVLLFILIMISAYIAYDTLGKSYIPEAEQYAQTENDPAEKKYDDATDFEVYTFDEKSVRLSDFRGRGAVVNFWATWCTPCVHELPYFDELLAAHPGEVAVVAVHSPLVTDDVAGYLSGFDYRFDFALDGDGSVFEAYGASSMLPQTIVVSPDGTIIHNAVGSVTYAGLTALLQQAQGTEEASPAQEPTAAPTATPAPTAAPPRTLPRFPR